jgi:endonuclease/exonuclease/phosphatase family metal-dependent hydrolase
LINSGGAGPEGAQYEYVLGPRLGRTSSKEQYVFIFDATTIEVDRSATYTVADPHDRLHREPLVALFRTKAASSGDAFTFKLVNIHTDPDDVPEEMNAMDDVYRAVFNDVDREDDIIVLGDFNTHEKRLHEFGEISGIAPALVDVKTNTRRTKSYDNLYFHELHTREFNGKSGIVDFVRVFNMTTEQALEISDHLPVWAEFSIFEGGGPGRLAARPDNATTPR